MMRSPEREVQSVSSETEEEESDEGTRNQRQPRQAEVHEGQPIEHPSPAPAVIQGGENEFVRVSHLASIEVKEVAQKHPPVLPRILLNNHNDHHTKTSTSTMNLSQNSAEKKKLMQEDADVFLIDSDSGAKAEPMETIEKSPYEKEYGAETGEKIFMDMKRLLTEDEQGVNPQAMQIFGPTNANCLVRANALIDKSGIVYSQEWVKGNIRGNMIGKIPNHLLLLCLVPKRFAKAGELLLSGLCRDLELYDIVNQAIDNWGLGNDYKLVRAATRNYQFTSMKKDSYKCAIFVARLFCCSEVAGENSLNNRLLSKARACLDIMEAHLPDVTSQKKKRKSISDLDISNSIHLASPATEAPVSEVANTGESVDSKKKRGRPFKHPKVLVAGAASCLASSETPVRMNSKRERKKEKDEDTSPLAGQSAGKSRRANKANVSSAASNSPTLQQLISRFEDQYEEMGKKYREMGESLSQMKKAAAESRVRTEEEIRMELLDEVQKSIMKSLPKK